LHIIACICHEFCMTFFDWLACKVYACFSSRSTCVSCIFSTFVSLNKFELVLLGEKSYHLARFLYIFALYSCIYMCLLECCCMCIFHVYVIFYLAYWCSTHLELQGHLPCCCWVVWWIHLERPFPVWSELERRSGSEWLVLGVQGLSHRVVWWKHQERPSPIRSELEQGLGSEWLELGVKGLSHATFSCTIRAW
jgi:hypothetical protein